MSDTQGTHRAKISIGNSEVLSNWAATCPKCYGNFRLVWPLWVLHIPDHRVVDTRCPFCHQAFSLVAGSLASCEESKLLAEAIVEGLA